MMTAAGMVDDAQAGGLSIFETATVRWLNVEEIITLLSTPGAIPMSMAPPTSPPPSGTLLLYDRSVVRNYKADGHDWIKKRNNPNKIREDHVKLRYKGQYRVAGTYVHSIDVSTLHRRAYRLIIDPASPLPVAYLGEDMPTAQNSEIVLVHYLDTLEAVRMSSLYADHLAAAASSKGRAKKKKEKKAAAAATSKSLGRGSSGDSGGGGSGGGSGGHPQEIQLQQIQHQQQQLQLYQHQQHGYGDYGSSSQGGYQQEGGDEDSDGLYADQLMASLGLATKGDSGGGHDRGESLDEGALDILWDMVLEEGGDDIQQDIQNAAASAIEQHITPGFEAQLVGTVEEAIQDVTASTLSERLTAVSDADIRDVVDQVLNEKQPGGGGNPLLGDIESKVVEKIEEKLPDGLQEKLAETMKEVLKDVGEGEDEDDEMDDPTPDMPPLAAFANHVSVEPPKPLAQLEEVPQTPLPEVIDFTPEDAMIRTNKPVKMVISTSSPIPILPPDEPPFRWHVIACFVDIGKTAEFANNNWTYGAFDPPQDGAAKNLPFSPDPLIMKVALAEVTKITPYSYKCYLPEDISRSGFRSIILCGIKYIDDENGPLWDAIRVAVKVCIQAEWNVASDLTNSENKARIYGSGLIRPKFYAPAGSGNVQLLSQLSQNMFQFTDVPALSAVPAEMAVSKVGESSRSFAGDSSKSVSELPAPAPAMATVASALTQFENNPPPKAVGENIPAASSRKRALTIDDAETENLVQDANQSAANWVTSVVPNSDGMTQGEDVNRHCKIRFVERLANVIVGTSDDAAAADASAGPSADNSGVSSPDAGYKDPGLYLSADGDSNLKDIGDEELDSLLHSVLMRFVESMVDSSTSEEELKEALNKPGFSGFTLMHYAALYNILSLIPLLLSRGADPEVLTKKGCLTPLHLAASAGHDQIVDYLVKNGCEVAPQDSFGLTPADHALRNGFTEISEWLVDKNRNQGGAKMSPLKPQDASDITTWTLDNQNEKGQMMQSAFRELSLKDKLGLNLFVQRYQRGGSNLGGGGSQSAMADIDEDDAKPDDIDVNFISEEDRESLKTAMSMMSKEELHELEKNAPYSNVRDWMIRSNYESLRDASLQLEKQAKRRALSAAEAKKSIGDQSDGGSASSKKFSHSKLSQVLAMLVLRKNLIGTGENENQGQMGGQMQCGQQQGGSTGSSDMETR